MVTNGPEQPPQDVVFLDDVGVQAVNVRVVEYLAFVNHRGNHASRAECAAASVLWAQCKAEPDRAWRNHP